MEINKNIIQSIEELRPLSNNLIDNNLRVNVPTKVKFDYIKKNKFNDTHRLLKGAFSLQDCTLLLTYDIPFNSNKINVSYMDTLNNLIRKNMIYPFLFFINRVFINWSNIYIIKDCRYSYILLPKHKEIDAKYEMILIPKNIKYDEMGIYDPEKTLFSFYDGYLYTGIERCTTIDKADVCDFYYEEIKLQSNVIQHFKMGPEREMADDNIIIFKDNKLYTDNLINHGFNMFSVDDNILKGDYIAKGFFYYKSNVRVNNNKVIMNKDRVVKEITKNNSIPKYYDLFKDKFNISFNINNTYENNIIESLYNIMSYNSNLMNRVYKKENKTLSKIYTGKELRLLSKKGKINMSRRINNSIHNYVMIFHNGKIYKHYHEITYQDKNFTFPFKDIKDEDTIELLYFIDVDNRDIRIKFGSRLEDRYYLDKSIDLSNMKLFTMQPENLDFNIEINPDKQYEIGFSYEINNDGTSTLIPDRPFYYDKRLFLSSKRQFRYLYHKCEYPRVDVILPKYFKFCNNFNQYLVFINGRKIDKKNYKILYPTVDTPFDDSSIYLNILLQKDDILEVFYLPDRLYECYTNTRLDSTGNIYINKRKLNHNVSKDLNFIFVNGKKIPSDWIYDIDQTRVKLTTDPESIYNVSIIQHIEPDVLLSNIFSDIDDTITESIDELNEAEFKKIIQDINVTNKDNSILANEFDMKKVLYKIMEDYYCQPFVSTGDNFLFEESELFTETDNAGNIIIRQDDANIEDKLGKED